MTTNTLWTPLVNDVLKMHASSSTLKPLDAVYHSAVRFITSNGFLTHRCVLYKKGACALSQSEESNTVFYLSRRPYVEAPYVYSLHC